MNIIEEYSGTNSTNGQGPTPSVAGNTWLSMKIPLDPFKKRVTLPIKGPWNDKRPPSAIDPGKDDRPPPPTGPQRNELRLLMALAR